MSLVAKICLVSTFLFSSTQVDGILCYFCEFNDQNVRNELNSNFFGVPRCAKESANYSARPLGHRCLYQCLGMGTVQCDTGCAKVVVKLRDQKWTLRDCHGSLERHHIIGKFNETVTHCQSEDYCNGNSNCFPNFGFMLLVLIVFVHIY